jgi:hypothetical protein
MHVPGVLSKIFLSTRAAQTTLLMAGRGTTPTTAWPFILADAE